MASAAAISANLSLQRGPASPVGPKRIALLKAIAETGSIMAAARSSGLSYKAAWDAVQIMNNLLDRPVVVARSGGRRGGSASVTDEGLALISAFQAVETELGHAIERIEARIGGDASRPLRSQLWSLGMKTSARNALRGVVDRVVPGAVNSEVILKIGDGAEIVAVVTRESAEELDLAPGRPVIALIKSSFVILAHAKGDLRTSARNMLSGTVSQIDRGAVNDVVTIDIGGGKSVTATVTHESVEDLELEPGEQVATLFEASQVILAVE